MGTTQPGPARPRLQRMAALPTLPARDDVEALVLRHRPLARHLAQRYVRATDQREDLEQVAYLGLQMHLFFDEVFAAR